MYVKLSPGAVTPSRANPTDAGIDLSTLETTTLPAMCRVLVRTGVSVKIPAGSVGLLVPRSSLSKNGIVMTNSIGVIDADYRGELLASLMYVGNGGVPAVTIPKGERIVQLIIMPIWLPTLETYSGSEEEWVDTDRGVGGFGSTGS